MGRIDITHRTSNTSIMSEMAKGLQGAIVNIEVWICHPLLSHFNPKPPQMGGEHSLERCIKACIDLFEPVVTPVRVVSFSLVRLLMSR